MPWIVDEVRSPDGKTIEKMRASKNPNSRVIDPALIEKAKIMAKKHFVIPEETLKKVQEFAQANKSFEMEFLGKMEKFEIDWEHILLPMVKERQHFNHLTKAYELKDFEIVGWHHGLWQEFEKQGLIRILKKKERSGCVNLEFTWGYNKTAEKKTFVPASWDYTQLRDNVFYCLRNAIEVQEKEGRFAGLGKSVIAQTVEGIEMEIILSRESLTASWNITTSFVRESFISGVK
jgi:hypothetical protein